MKEASGDVGIYTCEKLAPQNVNIATEIASISVFIVKLLLLPVCGTVSTSDLYPILFSEVGQCRYWSMWIGHARKMSVAADITLISLPVTDLKLLPVAVRHLEFTSAGNFRHGRRGYVGKMCKRKSLESRL